MHHPSVLSPLSLFKWTRTPIHMEAIITSINTLLACPSFSFITLFLQTLNPTWHFLTIYQGGRGGVLLTKNWLLNIKIAPDMMFPNSFTGKTSHFPTSLLSFKCLTVCFHCTALHIEKDNLSLSCSDFGK